MKLLSGFIFIIFTFIFSFGSVNTNLFVVFFKSCQIFSGFTEFSFFHTFTYVVMNKGSLGIHKVEFVIQSREYFCNSSRVRNHAHSSHYLGQIAPWDNTWRLVVNSAFESSWAPINKLDCSLSLDGCNRCIDVFGDNISSVHQTTSHVFSVSWVTFHHHLCRFKSR